MIRILKATPSKEKMSCVVNFSAGGWRLYHHQVGFLLTCQITAALIVFSLGGLDGCT